MPLDDAELPRGVVVPGPAVVHFDGACQTIGRRRIAAYGFTVDGAGLRHEESGLAVPPDHPRATNNVAEYVGAIRSLEWLLSAGYAGPVRLIGDSELVIRQALGEYAVKAEHLEPYHARLLQLAARFARVDFGWVRREENLRADALSKAGIATAASPARRPGQSPVLDADPDEPAPDDG